MFNTFCSALRRNRALSKMNRQELVAEYAASFPDASPEGINVKKLRKILRVARERGAVTQLALASLALVGVLVLGGCSGFDGFLPTLGPSAAGNDIADAPNVSVTVHPALIVGSDNVDTWSESGGTNARGNSTREAEGDGTADADFAPAGSDPLPAPPISALTKAAEAPRLLNAIVGDAPQDNRSPKWALPGSAKRLAGWILPPVEWRRI